MRGLLAWRGHALVALPMRLYLGAVFLWACWHKLLDPRAFALDVATYQLLPLWAVNATALTLPWVELAAGLLLVAGLKARAAAAMTAAMMAAFMVALAWALERGLNLSCGCFASTGAESDPISWWTMARDGAWLAMALYVAALDHRPLGLDRLLERRERAGAASGSLRPPVGEVRVSPP